MLPFMLSQAKHGHIMRKKMEIVKPYLKETQEKVKHARTQEERVTANQELMKKYKEYDMHPAKTMLGCLPLLIQMPILFGLYVTLKWPSSGGITEHPFFLWFNLLHPNIWITVIAGILYIIQPLVNLGNLPNEQRSMGYMMAIISPVFIVYISITSAAALGLYWAVNAAFLIVQMFFSNRYYDYVSDMEAAKLKNKLKLDNNSKKVNKTSKVIKKKKR